jgi:cysteine desulfuration protein SufE
MKTDAIQDEIIDDLSRLDGWFEKYEYLVGAGGALPCPDERLRVERNLMKGCQSKVWLSAERRGDKVHLAADSDALITKGILALLLRVLSGQSCQDVAFCELYFIERTGLASHLSPARANGVAAMVRQIRKLVSEVTEY